MADMETKTILASISEPTCDKLWKALVEKLTMTDLEELPTGQEILQRLSPQALAVRDHCISLFDDLVAVTGYLSSAYAKLPSLAKICNEKTFGTILNASARPLVQLNIPPKILNPITEEKPALEGDEYRNKLRQMLLPQERKSLLRKEARNSAMRLLAALVYLNFKKCYLNEGTQAETVEKFNMKPKALSKLLSGHKYLGGKDKKVTMKRKAQLEGRKLLVRKSHKSSTAVKLPDDSESNDNTDEGEGQQQ